MYFLFSSTFSDSLFQSNAWKIERNFFTHVENDYNFDIKITHLSIVIHYKIYFCLLQTS